MTDSGGSFAGETLLFGTQLSKENAPSGKRAMCISSRYRSQKKKTPADKAAKWKAEQKKKRKKKAKQNKGRVVQRRGRSESLLVEPVEVTGEVADVFEDAAITCSPAYLELKEKVLARLSDDTILQCSAGAQLEERIKEIINKEQEDTFYLLDLTTVLIKYLQWLEHLPRVAPLYGMTLAFRFHLSLSLSLYLSPSPHPPSHCSCRLSHSPSALIC